MFGVASKKQKRLFLTTAAVSLLGLTAVYPWCVG
jgi:hypothetical protein